MNPFPFGPFTWIPVLGILFPVFVLAVIFGFVALVRYLRYRERMMLVQKGITPADLDRVWHSRPPAHVQAERQPRAGIITSLVGLALLVGLWTVGTGPWLLGGLIPLAVGIGELLTWVITSPTREALKSAEERQQQRDEDENRQADCSPQGPDTRQ